MLDYVKINLDKYLLAKANVLAVVMTTVNPLSKYIVEYTNVSATTPETDYGPRFNEALKTSGNQALKRLAGGLSLEEQIKPLRLSPIRPFFPEFTNKKHNEKVQKSGMLELIANDTLTIKNHWGAGFGKVIYFVEQKCGNPFSMALFFGCLGYSIAPQDDAHYAAAIGATLGFLSGTVYSMMKYKLYRTAPLEQAKYEDQRYRKTLKIIEDNYDPAAALW